MTGAHARVLVLQVAIPLALVAWLALAPPADAATLIAAVGLGGAYLLALSAAAVWAMPPRAVLVVLVVAFWIAAIHAVLLAWPEGRAWPEGTLAWSVAGLAWLGAVALFALVLSLASARRPPPGPVAQIAFPLARGRYVVVSGGFHDLVNVHREVLAPGFEAVRGQAHAIDVLALDRVGLRARGLRPSDPAAYAIFGKPVVAPCAGRVIAARDDLPDLPPPQADRENLAGNHVLLACAGFDLLLAHLQRGSLAVAVGDRVAAGDRIGRVGNSGGTSEPHLHVHAQSGPRRRGLMDAEPIPIAIHGRFLVRNDIIEVD